MASDPKYGLTYKTTDGKTKTLTGINLGTGSYTDKQITAFIGIIATVTNKTVTALDITTANAIPPPKLKKDLIESFTISPSALSITIGNDPVTAEAEIVTDPQDAPYQLSIPDAPAWVSIDGTTLVFAPPAGTTVGDYSFTVVAMTKNDDAEYMLTLKVKEPITPNLKMLKPGQPLNVSYVSYTSNTSYYTYKITFLGRKGTREIKLSGSIPLIADNYSSVQNTKVTDVYSESENITTIEMRITAKYSKDISSVKTGSKNAILQARISAGEGYKAQNSSTSAGTFTGCYAIQTYNKTI